MRKGKARVRLIHWKAEGAETLARALATLGYEVDEIGHRDDRTDPPSAFVIDLSRRPSQGRDLGVSLRVSKATRRVPLVFVGGDPERVDGVRALLPDATFCSWQCAPRAIARTMAKPLANPVVPKSVFAAFEGRPLSTKLGIRPNMTVGLLGAPSNCRATLGELPPGVLLRNGAREGTDVVLWFVKTQVAVKRRIESLGVVAAKVWVLWPKRSARVKSDLTQPIVRKAGLDRGLVDYKVVSFDETWTGLLFTRRSRPRPP